MKKWQHLSLEQWRELIEHQVASGMAVRRYCQVHDLSHNTFYRWRRAVQDAAGAAEPAAVVASLPSPTFVELKPAQGWSGPPASGIELVLAGGLSVRVGPGFDGPTLRRLVEVLS